MKKALTSNQEQQLLVEYEDGWTINEISVIFKVSERTVYRVLSRYEVPLRDDRRRKFKRTKVKDRVLKPCGTNAGYHRHRRNMEYPCSICLAAHVENVRQAKLKRIKREAGTSDLARR